MHTCRLSRIVLQGRNMIKKRWTKYIREVSRVYTEKLMHFRTENFSLAVPGRELFIFPSSYNKIYFLTKIFKKLNMGLNKKTVPLINLLRIPEDSKIKCKESSPGNIPIIMAILKKRNKKHFNFYFPLRSDRN